MVAAGILKLVPLRTHLMVADVLTKSLPSPAHIKTVTLRWDMSLSLLALYATPSGGGDTPSRFICLSTCSDRGSFFLSTRIYEGASYVFSDSSG